MMAMLTAYFRPGTYDLLRKNCNSFTSCALHFLLGAMLDPKYSSMESCAVTVSSYIDLVSLIMPNYQPNPNAEGFCVEHVRRDINYHEQKAAQGAKAKAPSRAWILVVGLRRKARYGRDLLRQMLCGKATTAVDPKETKAEAEKVSTI
ncbi:unnamed protein product [Effrenium voratum]|nr:unnamed protein product [Effrenium voratum]